MSEKVLTVQERIETGSAASRRVRGEGLVPAVVYGHAPPQHILVDKREFRTAFKHISESEIITLKIGKKKVQVLIKDYQMDVVRGELSHLDFFEIEAGKIVRTHVPVHFTGNAQGVREGGILEAPVHELEIECLPKDLPSEISVDVSELVTGSSIHVGDLAVPQGVKILTSEEMVVAAVTHARVAIETSEEEELEDEKTEEASE